MSRGTVAGGLFAILFFGPHALAAQDESDSTAYRALTQTPIGALGSVIGPALTARRRAGLSFHGRYGLMSFRSRDYVHNFGLGAQLPVAAGRMGITAGYYGPTCSGNDCPGHFMGSIEFDQSLVSLALGRPEDSGSLNVGVTAGVGLGTPDDATLFSGALRVPVALVPRMRSARLFPYIAPGVGVGLIDSHSGTDAGLLPTFAVGVGLLAFNDQIGVVAGISRVFLKGGNWLAGVSLTWNPQH